MSSEILGGSAVTPAEPAVEAAGSRLLRNISMLAGGQLTTWVLTGLWTIVVPRGIGPRGMGLLVTAWAAAGIMSVMVGLGTRDLLVRRIAVNPAEAPAIVGTAITLRALLSLPGLLLVLAFASFTGFGPEQRLVLMFFSGTTLLLLLLEPIQAAFQALERMKYLAYADVLAKAGVSAGGIALVLFGFGPVALVALGCSIGVVILALNLVWIRRYVRIHWGFRFGEIRGLFRDSLAYWAFSAFFTLYLWIDSAMLSVMTTPIIVGWYGVPTKVWGALMFVPVILATALLPRFSIANLEGEEKLREVARPFIELVVVLSLPAAAGLALVSTPLIELLWTPTYIPSIPVMVIIALSAPATYLNILLNQLLIAKNQPWVWTKVMAAAAVLNILLNLTLIPFCQSQFGNGAVGAAISLTATEIAVAAIGLRVVSGFVTARSCWRVLRAAGATLVMALVVWAIRDQGPFLEILVGGLTFAAVALLLRVPTSTDIQTIRSLIPRRSG